MRDRGGPGGGGRAAPALGPAGVELGNECLGAAVDARAYAHLLQECDEPLVLHRMVVGKDLSDVARIGEPLALGHAQEKPREPVGEIAADQQQVVVLEFVEQLFGRQVLGLQRADKLEHVLVGDDVGRRGREPAEQVIDHRSLQLAALHRQVGDTVRGVGDHLSPGLTAIALEVHGFFEQWIECGGDEQVEVGDLRQLPQGVGRLELDLAHDGTQARVGFFATSTLTEVGADDIVQHQRLGQARRVDRQAHGEFFRQPFVKRSQPAIGLHTQQVRTDDRDDASLLDVVEEIVPGVVVKEIVGGQFG